jgi:DNA polymerase elongation subunit (family B)
MSNNIDKTQIISEIKQFLDGRNDDIKYLVNLETSKKNNIGKCIIHEPEKPKKIVDISYIPFLFIKDLKKHNITLYNGDKQLQKSKMGIYGIDIQRLSDGQQDRLENGYNYLVQSTISYNSILEFFKDGGLDLGKKKVDKKNRLIKDARGNAQYEYRDLYYSVSTNEQFLISKKTRFYKGLNEYKDIHRLIFDIETTDLRSNSSRCFAIGIADNRGFETILSVDKDNDDESEKKLIIDFFSTIDKLKPSIISGYNSEKFDFSYLLERTKILNLDLTSTKTSLNENRTIWRRNNASVKFGNAAERYTATEMWGYTIFDIYHSARKTAALNSDIKNTKLKYIAKYENIAKPNRTYVDGKDGNIGKYWKENKVFLINTINEYIQLPNEYQVLGDKLLLLQNNKSKISVEEYNKFKGQLLNNQQEFIDWFKINALPDNKIKFIKGKDIIKQYLLDDLWETQQVDELYNQSTFLLCKTIPEVAQKTNTMGTAAVWNLLLTAWSYENKIAIPYIVKKEDFSGGLTRCYKKGFSKNIIKIDYASLYPSIQLTEGVFPVFDITGVIEKILIYLTTTRNIYKKLANGTELDSEEVILLAEIDSETHIKYINKTIKPEEWNIYKVKQLPIKILNNSLFGALGSGISFNWSDNVCAARITCVGRLHLRHAISWFKPYNCQPLLAVTDGINFMIPETTNIIVNNDEENVIIDNYIPIKEAWKYSNKIGVSAIIAKFNHEIKIFNESQGKQNFISIDEDGEFLSCLNLSRINYALLYEKKNKKTGLMETKVKLTGNSIKSKTMPEYIEDFIDKGMRLILEGKGDEFVDYYHNYAEDIFYKKIPLRKIASKSKIKCTISDYKNRGKDKNGRAKGKQAHMELLVEERNSTAIKLFKENIDKYINIENNNIDKTIDDFTIEQITQYVSDLMPLEPDLDSMLYYINIGSRKGDGDSKIIKDIISGKDMYASKLISSREMDENPDLTGNYNVLKYLSNFNTKVKIYLEAYDPEIRSQILVQTIKKKMKDANGNKTEKIEFVKNYFTKDQLILKNFDHDEYDSSMKLEHKEILFWNNYGYDPNKIWDGYNTYDDDKLYPEIYQHALDYLNIKMKESNKPVIKSIDDKLDVNDLILFKNKKTYNLGHYNGNFIEIIRENVDIPKHGIEIELEKQSVLDEVKLKRLKLDEGIDETEVTIKSIEQLFIDFKKEYNIPEKFTIEDINKIPKAKNAFNDFVEDYNNDLEEDEEDSDVEEFEDYSYD